MKKVLALMVVGALCVGTLAGCGNSSTDETAEASGSAGAETEEVVSGSELEDEVEEVDSGEVTDNASDALIAISVPKATTGWTAAVSYYAEKYCEDNGLNYLLVQADNTNDQANQVDDLLSQDPDIFILHPLNDELASAAETIMDAGVTLIDFDRELGDANPDYYLAGSNVENGAKGADWLADQLGDDFTVAVLTVTSWGNIATERVEGFEEELAEVAPNATVVGEYASEGASQEEGLSLAADVLTANPELDAIYLVDDEQACGALQAISEAGRDDIQALFACGGGASTFLEQIPDSSFPIATVSYYPTLICDAIQMAVDILNGETFDSKVIEDGVVIEASNVEEWKASIGFDENAPY